MQLKALSRNTLLIAVLALAGAAYVQSFSHLFVLDDHDLLDRIVSVVHAPWDAFKIGNAFQSYYRPLFLISLWIDSSLFGDTAAGFHVMNLLLHLTAVWCAFRFGERLFSDARYAAAAAVLFAMAPVHTENVSWVSGRTDLLCAIFVFLSLISFYDLVIRREKRNAWIAPLWFVCALASKETAAVVPVLCLVMYALRNPLGATKPVEVELTRAGKSTKRKVELQKKAQSLASSYGISAALFIAGLVIFMILRSSISGAGFTENVFLTTSDRLLNASRCFAMYIWHAALGGGYDYIITGWRVADPAFNLGLPLGTTMWIAVVITIACFVGALVLAIKTKRGVAALGLFGFAFFVAPALGFVPILSIFSVRFLYIPSFFLALAVVDGARAVLSKSTLPMLRTVAVGAVVGVALWFGVETFMQDANWHDDVTLMQSLKKSNRDISASPVYYFCLANGFRYRGDFMSAAVNFRHAIERWQDYTDAYVNLGGSYQVLGETHPDYYAQASETYSYAIKQFPHTSRFHVLLGDVQMRTGEQEKARQSYYQAYMMDKNQEAKQKLAMMGYPLQ